MANALVTSLRQVVQHLLKCPKRKFLRAQTNNLTDATRLDEKKYTLPDAKLIFNPGVPHVACMGEQNIERGKNGGNNDAGNCSWRKSRVLEVSGEMETDETSQPMDLHALSPFLQLPSCF